MSDLIDELRGFSKAYPEDMFPPFTDEERTAYSVVISRASGAMGRHCAKHMARAADEIERLTAALHAQPGPVSMDDVEWAGKAHLHDAQQEIERLRAAAQHEADCAEAYRAQVEAMIRERDELRRQLDGAEQTISDLQDALRTAVNAAMGASNE